MSNDIRGLLPQKTKNSLTIPGKKTTPTTSPATPKTTDRTVKMKAVKPKKVKPLVQQTQQPQYQLSDFMIQTTVDNVGIHIATTYLGTPIHQFILPVAQFANWQRADPRNKYNFVQSRTFANAFFGDLRITQAVVTATINVIDNLFSRAQQKARM
jgi:hypothetical protein